MGRKRNRSFILNGVTLLIGATKTAKRSMKWRGSLSEASHAAALRAGHVFDRAVDTDFPHCRCSGVHILLGNLKHVLVGICVPKAPCGLFKGCRGSGTLYLRGFSVGALRVEAPPA